VKFDDENQSRQKVGTGRHEYLRLKLIIILQQRHFEDDEEEVEGQQVGDQIRRLTTSSTMRERTW